MLLLFSFSFFFFFLALQETLKISNETYGSDGFQVEFLRDKKGKLIKGNCLFHNIYDFWVSIHASGFMKVSRWYHPKVAKLEKVLRKMWKHLKIELPIINVLLRKIKERGLVFDPSPYLQDEEQYFGNLQSWKISFGKQYLEKYPFLK